MKNYLQEKFGLVPGEKAGEFSVHHSNSAELAEYLKLEPKNPDLSHVDFHDPVEICGLNFDSFTADVCDFGNGFAMVDCNIRGSLYLRDSYIYQRLSFKNVNIIGDLHYPENLSNLIAEYKDAVIEITGLRVKGATRFTLV